MHNFVLQFSLCCICRAALSFPIFKKSEETLEHTLGNQKKSPRIIQERKPVTKTLRRDTSHAFVTADFENNDQINVYFFAYLNLHSRK